MTGWIRMIWVSFFEGTLVGACLPSSSSSFFFLGGGHILKHTRLSDEATTSNPVAHILSKQFWAVPQEDTHLLA